MYKSWKFAIYRSWVSNLDRCIIIIYYLFKVLGNTTKEEGVIKLKIVRGDREPFVYWMKERQIILEIKGQVESGESILVAVPVCT